MLLYTVLNKTSDAYSVNNVSRMTTRSSSKTTPVAAAYKT